MPGNPARRPTLNTFDRPVATDLATAALRATPATRSSRFSIDFTGQARLIADALAAADSIAGKLVRIKRPE